MGLALAFTSHVADQAQVRNSQHWQSRPAGTRRIVAWPVTRFSHGNVSFMPSYELLAAYCRTHYHVELPNQNFSIRLGDASPELDGYLSERGRSDWAIITAENPRSHQLSEDENAERQERLRQRLDESRDCNLFPAVAVCPLAQWPPEHGLLVAGMSEGDALSVAREFDQHAIVCGRVGECARLRLVDPTAWRATLDRALDSGGERLRKVSQNILASQFRN